MAKTTPPCPYCNEATHLGTRQTRYRRGNREVAVETRFWECPGTCVGPDGQQPFRFQDPPLMRQNDEAARSAWLHRFDEPMPTAGRPGRKVRTARTVPLQVRLTPDERAEIQRLQAGLSLSDFVRYAVFRRPASPRAPRFPLTDTAEPNGPHRKVS